MNPAPKKSLPDYVAISATMAKRVLKLFFSLDINGLNM